jgi:hypothetical protein
LAVQKIDTYVAKNVEFSYLAVQKIDTYIAKNVEFSYFVMGSHLGE